uniref:Uncharacterized protein n=1 Tax=Ursus maritimus TaxID=29073 RepID=A0A452TZ35_URSMA
MKLLNLPRMVSPWAKCSALDLQNIPGATLMPSDFPLVSPMWPRKALRESHDEDKGKVDCAGTDINGLPTKGPMETSGKKTEVIVSKDLIVLKMDLII